MRLPSCTIVLGKVKSGAGMPTFRFVCGVGGVAGLAGVGVGVGWPIATDAAANKKATDRIFLIIAGSYAGSAACCLRLIGLKKQRESTTACLGMPNKIRSQMRSVALSSEACNQNSRIPQRAFRIIL